MTRYAYTEAWRDCATDDEIVVRLYDPRPTYYRGGLHRAADAVRRAGSYEDDVLLHLNRAEFAELRRAWGPPTINPVTGLPEYSFLKRLVKKVGSTAKRIIKNPLVQTLAPIAANVFLPGVGGLIAGSLIGATGAKANGQNPILGGLMGLGGSFAGRAAGTALKGAGGAKGILGKLTGASGENPGDLLGGLDSAMNSPLGKVSRFFQKEDGSPAWGKIAGIGGGALALLGGLGGRGGDDGGGMPAVDNGPPLQQLMMNRTRSEPTDYFNYGKKGGEHRFFGDPSYTPIARAGGGGVRGPGTGRSDEIEALLSDGEYVMDAETVAMLGDGSSEAGAKRLDEMRANLRRHKGKNLVKGKFSANAKAPEEYLGSGKGKPKRSRRRRKAKGGSINVLHSLAAKFESALASGNPKRVAQISRQLDGKVPGASRKGIEEFAKGGKVGDVLKALLQETEDTVELKALQEADTARLPVLEPPMVPPMAERRAKGPDRAYEDLLRLKNMMMPQSPEERKARFEAMTDAELEEHRRWMNRLKDAQPRGVRR